MSSMEKKMARLASWILQKKKATEIPFLKVRGAGAAWTGTKLIMGKGKTLHFYITPDMKAGDTMLTVDAPLVKISGSDICMSVDGEHLALQPGNVITLIHSTGKFVSDHNGKRALNVQDDGTLYDFFLFVDDNALKATVGSLRVRPIRKSA